MIIRNIAFFLSYLFIVSCNPGESESQADNSLKQWILSNQRELNSVADTIIQGYHERNKTNSNWTSSSIAIAKYSPDILGRLAEKAGNSTDCIVIELTFYKDPNQKKMIMIAAEDSTCLDKFKAIILKTDSTNNFIFGKNNQSLY